jgi:DNA-binding LacI/PurR family transcriptional regulator
MADVGRLAGVSHQTVSRVINDSARVTASTRRRVLDAIAELGYRRNLAARALATNRTFALGFVVVNAHLSGPSATLIATERAAESAGYSMTVVSLDTVSRDAVVHGIERLRDHAVDGIVVIAPTGDAVDAAIEVSESTPMVLVTSCEVADSELSSVEIDQEWGARLAMEHLLALGHTRIAHLSGPMDEFHARARAMSWRDTLNDAGLPVLPMIEGDWSPVCGYREALKAIQQDPPPTAVFVANDHMALGLLRAFHEAGIRVPQDIAVVGFDDIVGVDQAIPPLTTVRQDHVTVARTAVQLLVDRIGGAPAARVRIAPVLVERESTAKISGMAVQAR